MKTEKLGYLNEIKKIWTLKEKVYRQTKNMNFQQYCIEMNKDINEIKKNLKDKYVKLKP